MKNTTIMVFKIFKGFNLCQIEIQEIEEWLEEL